MRGELLYLDNMRAVLVIRLQDAVPTRYVRRIAAG